MKKECEIKTEGCQERAVGWIPKYKFSGETWACANCYEKKGKYKPLTIE